MNKTPERYENDEVLVKKKDAIFEDIWKLVGGFGRYPIVLTLFMCYMTMVLSLHQFVQTYYGSAPNFQCIQSVQNKTDASLCPVNKCGCQNCTLYVFRDDFTSAVSEITDVQ